MQANTWRSIPRSELVLPTLTALLLGPGLAWSQEATPAVRHPALHALAPRTPQELQELFKHTAEPLPLVSAHRGGPQKNLPENCLATFENTLRHTFAVLEVDPRYTKDGAIVLHHDARLERTTTGRGLVADFTLQELKQLRLKDPDGTVTDHQIPTLDEALQWARGRTILILDQKDVPVAARVKKVEEHKAEAYAVLIVYSFKDAQACHRLNPNVMMEVMISTRAQFDQFDKTGVPWGNIVAFVGHLPAPDAKVCDLIHGRGATCIVGTSRHLDQRFISGETTDLQVLEPDYRALLQRGADLIETDLPAQLGPPLFGATRAPLSKEPYFRVQ
jgi:glycerophosphoryl diester phosphodiesterase